VVVVRGSSGAGKTALLSTFLDDLASDPRVLILRGRCYEQESVPFKALDSIVDSLSQFLRRLPETDVQAFLPRDVHTLARLFPVLRQVAAIAGAPLVGQEASDPQELRRRAAVALRELLARVGDRRSLVVAIDDLQWGDVDSAALLTDVLTLPDAPVMLGIGCARTDDIPASPFFTRLRQTRTGTKGAHEERDILLGPLDMRDAQTLAVRLLNKPDRAGALTELVVRESAGEPFLVYELVEHVRARADGFAKKSFTLAEVLGTRVEQLPTSARSLLEVVATAGKPIERTVASQAAGLDRDDQAVVTLLRNARLIRRSQTGLEESIEAYHDRVRECVLAHLPDTERQQWHARLAQTFEALGSTDLEALAFHHAQSGEADRAAMYYARSAAAAAEALAFDHAASLYERALGLKRWTGAEQCQLRTRLGDALANAGRGAIAAAEYVAAAEGTDPGTRLELHRRAALQLLTSGHVDEGLARLRPVLNAVGTRLARTPWQALASLTARRLQLRARGLRFEERDESRLHPSELQRIDIGWSAVVGLSLIDPIRGADFQTRNLLLALRAGEPFRVARALAVEAAHLASSGATVRASSVLAHAEDLANRIQRPYAAGIVLMASAAIQYFAERWKDSLRLAGEAEATFRQHCTGVAWELDTASAFGLWSLAKMGEIAELSRVCPALLKEARGRGDRYATTNLATQIMTLVRLGTDQADEARAELEDVMRRWSQNGYHVQHHDALLAMVPIELYCDKPVAAWDRVQREWAAFRWSLLSQIQDVRVEMLQMRSYCALAMAARATEPGEYLEVAQRDARRLRREGLPWTVALVDYVEGCLALRNSDLAGARHKLMRAIAEFDHVHAGLYSAATRYRLADVFNDEEALAMREQAAAWFAGQSILSPARMAAAYAPGLVNNS
jgi:hypothetical protein